MNKGLVAVLILLIVCMAGVASAEELTGRISLGVAGGGIFPK